MTDKRTCTCGTETNVKKNGDLWKHDTPDGVRCTTDATHDIGGLLPEGFSFTAVNNTEQPEVVLTPPKEEKTEESVFTFKMRVHRKNEGLHDTGWHNANKQLAIKKATAAGHVVAGKAKLVSKETDDGPKVTYTYTVPVKEG